MEDLSTSQKLTLEQYFNNQIFPLLTPLDMDAPEAPALPSLKLLMGVELRDNETGEVRSAVVALPDGLPRRVPVPSAEAERYVMLEDLVRECIGTVFPVKPFFPQRCSASRAMGILPCRRKTPWTWRMRWRKCS